MILGLALFAFISLSLYIGVKNSVNIDWVLQFNTFAGPYYTLGLVYRRYEETTEDEEVINIDVFNIGMLFVEIEFTFYKLK